MENQKIIPIELGIITVFLIAGKKLALVDTGIGNASVTIVDRINNLGFNISDISLIIITHGHADHYDCASELKNITGAPVLAHKLDAGYIMNGSNPEIKTTRKLRKWAVDNIINPATNMKARPVIPDIIIDDNFNLEKFGINGKIIPTPGHTEGSISILLSNSEVIVGDLIMSSIVFKSKPSIPLYANDLFQLKESIKKIIELNPSIIHTSHGGPFFPEQIIDLIN
ncbi:MAG: hypothetical protein A2W19_13330 [Spirochaetes bacterium RBG_16_49_21]|nr:MAG: hypothetical protein A2W19_13330 [Spirochaetes bacterium RBG_16_49_21]